MAPRPENSDNKFWRTREGVYSNPDVVSMFVRIETEGLTACPRSSGTNRCDWADAWPCERCEVETALGVPIDPERPSDLVIAHVLRIWAEYEDYFGLDRQGEIHRAHKEGKLLPEFDRARLSPRLQGRQSALIRNRLVKTARINHRLEVLSAAEEILMQRQWLSPDGMLMYPSGSGLDPSEARALRALQRGRDAVLPAQIRQDAEELVDRRARRARGEIPRTVRVGPDRHRVATYTNPSFSDQLGDIRTETDPRKLALLVAELRRKAKKRGLLPPDHDRRKRKQPSA